MELDAGEENLGDDILSLSTADIQARTRLMDNEVRIGPYLIVGTKLKLRRQKTLGLTNKKNKKIIVCDG